jgi:hypothetical protein
MTWDVIDDALAYGWTIEDGGILAAPKNFKCYNWGFIYYRIDSYRHYGSISVCNKITDIIMRRTGDYIHKNGRISKIGGKIFYIRMLNDKQKYCIISIGNILFEMKLKHLLYNDQYKKKILTQLKTGFYYDFYVLNNNTIIDFIQYDNNKYNSDGSCLLM